MTWPGRKGLGQRHRSSPMERGQGYCVKLDEAPIRTPGKNLLAVPTSRLAGIIAREWDSQDTEVVSASLPVTRLCNFAIDRADDIRKEVIDRALRYGESDLLCYRSADDIDLRLRQSQVWDPILIWAERDLAASFNVTSGVVRSSNQHRAWSRSENCSRVTTPSNCRPCRSLLRFQDRYCWHWLSYAVSGHRNRPGWHRGSMKTGRLKGGGLTRRLLNTRQGTGTRS